LSASHPKSPAPSPGRHSGVRLSVFSIFFGLLSVAVALYGFWLLRERPGLPSGIKVENLVRIDSFEVRDDRDIEFIMSRKRIGAQARTALRGEGGRVSEKEILFVPYYSRVSFPVIYLAIGLFCLVLGFFVLLRRPGEPRARIFYWVALAFTFPLVTSGGFHCLRGDALSYLPGIFFYLYYPLAPALLLRFSLSFSPGLSKKKTWLVYLPALGFIISLEASFLFSGVTSSLPVYRTYQSILYVFRFYLVGFVFLAFLHLVLLFRKSQDETTRAQIKWILYGLAVGLGPFILLYQVPVVLRSGPVLSEEFSAVFFVFVPATFAVSILRYRLMNIELIIRRSLVYGTLTVFTVSLYLFAVQLFQALLARLFPVRQAMVSVAAALTAATAFHPARKRIQEWVDRTFYRTSYDYRRTILDFNARARNMVKTNQLIRFFLAKVHAALPVEKREVCIYSLESREPRRVIGWKEGRDLYFRTSGCLKEGEVLARKNALRSGIEADFSQADWLEEKKLELAIPVAFRSVSWCGFVCLGRKLSGERFTSEDLELLKTMAGELALNLERIKLQEDVIYERAEKEKLDALNRLKTEFVSTVSHELRTPMTSIRGITEMLHEGRVKAKTRQDELLRLLAAESARLSRFLENLLSFGPIERQSKKYQMKRSEMNSLVREVVGVFESRLEKEGFRVQVEIPRELLFLVVDADAVKQALTNLIDNAIKYSGDRREIRVAILDRGGTVELLVEDKGIGIPQDEQEKIFEKFYRHREAYRHHPQGVGLGLKLAKHIMEGHKGKIEVESRPGQGSTFRLVFPKK